MRRGVAYGTLVVLVALSLSCTSASESDGPPSPLPSAPSPAAHTSIKDAVASLGAACSTELWSGDCSWLGMKFLLAIPPTWRKGVLYRRNLCNHLVIDVRMLTDGRRWWIATRRDVDMRKLRGALARMGVHGDKRPYCPQNF